jgi:hypothetical protein
MGFIVSMSNMGNISFDMDGCLANFTRGILRAAHELYGTPVGGHYVQKTWYYHEWPALGLTKEQVGEVWALVTSRPGFWADLDPFNPSIMPRINRLTNRVFITNRHSIDDPAAQTVRFLERWGVQDPTVVVAAAKAQPSIDYNVVAHVDDYYPNCVEILKARPEAYVALLWTEYNEVHHAEWTALGGSIVLSIDHYLDEVDRRGLSDYRP